MAHESAVNFQSQVEYWPKGPHVVVPLAIVVACTCHAFIASIAIACV